MRVTPPKTFEDLPEISKEEKGFLIAYAVGIFVITVATVIFTITFLVFVIKYALPQ